MRTSIPDSVRYVKNGEGGRWWRVAKDHRQIHFGWSNVPDALLGAADLAAIDALPNSMFGTSPSAATRDRNALRSLLDHPSQHVWITFQDGFMWWCTVRDEVTVNPEGTTRERGHGWLTCDGPWINRSIGGRFLATSDLPGVVTSTAGFQGTVCEPKGWREVLRIIRDERDPAVAAADEARRSYEAAIKVLIARLGPKDFELLIDLVLSRTGWVRIAKLGGSIEGIDVEAENATSGEIAFVQVKSTADQTVLDDYIGRFEERPERYARMIFAVHTPRGTLVSPDARRVQVWNGDRIAELVVSLGLGDWVAKHL